MKSLMYELSNSMDVRTFVGCTSGQENAEILVRREAVKNLAQVERPRSPLA